MSTFKVFQKVAVYFCIVFTILTLLLLSLAVMGRLPAEDVAGMVVLCTINSTFGFLAGITENT